MDSRQSQVLAQLDQLENVLDCWMMLLVFWVSG